MLFEEARGILNRYCQQLEHNDASTNKVVQQGPNRAAAQESWWVRNDGRTPDWRNARTVAYFCGYVEIAGSSHIPMQGIPLDDGYMWLDRAVMRALLERQCVLVEGGYFRVTPNGELLLAPMVRVKLVTARARLTSGPATAGAQ